jgi:TatD family-associated radical SAM protein
MNTYVYKYGGSLYINLTNRCSNACAFCIRTRQEGLGGNRLWLESEPSAADVIAALRDNDFRSAPEVVFCGYGEPTCRLPELLETARFLRGEGVPVRLDTNGQGNLINGRDITDDLAECIDVVSISLNNSTARAYQAACRSRYGERAFGAVLDFARLCVPKFKKTVMTVVGSIGAEEIEECRALCGGIGAEFRVRVPDSYA